MEEVNDNKIVHDDSGDYYEYNTNFVSTPWDDRSTKSKIGIISLLLGVFAAILACVTFSLVKHFSISDIKMSTRAEIKCNLIKVDEYKSAARIHSISTRELLCVGAVIGPTTVIANGVCVKSGPIRLHLGSLSNPRCKKGFSVDAVEPIVHEGTVSKHLVLLTSYEKMSECGQVIEIGEELDWNAPAYIIGRPLRGGRSLSRQQAKLVRVEALKGYTIRNVNLRSTVCVMDLGRCPVRAGDLLVQGGRVYGLAATSTHATDQANVACFADLRMVTQEL